MLQQGVAIIRQTGLRSRAAADLYLLDGVVRYAASGAEADAVALLAPAAGKESFVASFCICTSVAGMPVKDQVALRTTT
jgi:hypothetical protein